MLGSCGAWPEPGRACSGFVLEHAGHRVVLDLGYGTLPRLLELVRSPVADGVDAVVVTHDHPDHVVDLHGLFRARWFGARGAPRIPLFAPTGVVSFLEALERDDSAAVHQVFDWCPLPAEPYAVGPFRIESVPLPHFVTNVGVRLVADGLVVAYTGDTGPDPALAELGRDADLFVVDATDREQRPESPPAPEGPLLNLTGRLAGAAAEAAGAGRLLLTHFWPGNQRERTRADARRAFDGEVLIADEGLVVDLGPTAVSGHPGGSGRP